MKNTFLISSSSNAIGKMKRQSNNAQQGATLVISLILLLVISMLGLAAAQTAIQEEKASRNDRDREVAFQAAQAALEDAELDIANSPASDKSRSHIFSKNSNTGFPEDGEAPCQSGSHNIYAGLCRHSAEGEIPPWIWTDLAATNVSKANAVLYGAFTGKTFPVGHGTLPSKLPRYIIELLPYNLAGESAEHVSYIYRVTAIGFGARESTKVVLQSFYRKNG
jgi:type IV pilus assembly protein PilX